MVIEVGCEIAFLFPQPTPMIVQLYLHPTRAATTVLPDQLTLSPPVAVQEFYDGYGNRCGRFVAPSGSLTLKNRAVVLDSGLPDLQVPDAQQVPLEQLPCDVLMYLLPSRYCEVDSDLKDVAWRMFGQIQPGWQRVASICEFVHHHIQFDYRYARANRTAREAYRERVGVCRDFAHLAITFCRNANIPARYCTGYLGDIGVPANPFPMDFSAWFEAYLAGQWYAFDPRNRIPRIGRVLMARGRDAADVALTTTFGENQLTAFHVTTHEAADKR